MLSSNLPTYFKQEAQISTWKYGKMAWVVGEFGIHNEFQNSLPKFWIWPFFFTYEFNIDLEVTLILNSATYDWVLR